MQLEDHWFDEIWAAAAQGFATDDELSASYAGCTEARGPRGPAPPPPQPLSFDENGFPIRQPVPTLTERLRRLANEPVE
jgi:hypothetical protein